ncbi:MAG: leucine--tRNA ligase [Betaproteobacteria bacterium]|nr:leucine--tRNA ligase [Betaproteobacteria bacterium]
MDQEYSHRQIEAVVQKRWQDEKCFCARESDARPKYYCLSMLPYPSGRLHMGHVRNYSIGDALSRYRRMNGFGVLQPMGWDAFGLPAENAAIGQQRHPAEWTRANIEQMRSQICQLGFAIDWQRELATCDSSYYRWEQLLFLRMREKGIAYRATGPVNWDPVDKTVLANEQVIDGCGWRTNAPVVRREIPMWFLKITAYAEELLAGLDDLAWPEAVKNMQRNWIGKSTGMNIVFDLAAPNQGQIRVYTTRPDTLMGATFMAIAAEHPLAKQAAANDPQVAQFCQQCQNIAASEEAIAKEEKRGLPIDARAVNPVSGEKIPVWIANYVLMEYGEGAVMGVPAHDQRDFEFARANNIPIRRVIARDGEDASSPLPEAVIERGIAVNSGVLDGSDYAGCVTKLLEILGPDKKAEQTVRYRLRDWGVSRQRYWGCPIPMIYCPDCGEVPVPEADLPVVLPDEVTVDGVKSPLPAHAPFVNCTCPICGSKKAKRETDTFDTFVESSWYFSRYACADSTDAMLDERAGYWLPVDQYIGGIEHAVLHLLYARFFHKVMRDLDFLPAGCGDEPFTSLLCQGMVIKDGAKMSKSRGNTVDPQQYVESIGADATRMFMIFSAPPDQKLEWSDSGARGCARYLARLWKQAHAARAAVRAQPDDQLSENAQARHQLHAILQKADFDMRRIMLNNIVSAGMSMANLLAKHPDDAALLREGFSILLRLLNPVVPHITERLWEELGFAGLLVDASWPEVDKQALAVGSNKMVVQVNGKKCAQIEVDADANQEQISQKACAIETVQKRIGDKKIRKVIVVPGKIINIVT